MIITDGTLLRGRLLLTLLIRYLNNRILLSISGTCSLAAAITRYGWDPIPMPSSVIERVNRLGKDQPELLLFTDRKGRLVGEAEPTGVGGAEQSVQDEELENDVGLDAEGAEDEEDLVEEIEISDQV